MLGQVELGQVEGEINKGLCIEYGMETKFIDNKHGYRKYCSRQCMFGSDVFRRKQALAKIGKTISEESKIKISKKLKGRIVSQQTRNKISNIHKGKHLSDEVKKKISISSKGKRISQETRDKISMANMGRVISQDTKDRISNANKGLGILPHTYEGRFCH